MAEQSQHDHYFNYHKRKWGLGIILPLLLCALAAYGYVGGGIWWMAAGSEGFTWIEGPSVPLYATGLVGMAIGLFGWFFAYNTERLNPWYGCITGIGCVITIVFCFWGFGVYHFPGW